MGGCFRVASSQYDSHLFKRPSKSKLPKSSHKLTILEQKPNIVFEQATSSYSFRSSELSQPIWSFSS